MSSFNLGLLPSGRLHCFPSTTDDSAGKATHSAPIDRAFGRSVGEGLFALAAEKSGASLSPSLQYWRNFARKYLSERCLLAQTDPQRPDAIAPLTASETMPLLLSAPPMQGAEYLSAPVLQDIRALLDGWVCEQMQATGGLSTLLTKKAPQWHQVGRVCFHLAENKNDPNYPFAFMATYAPEISEQGRIRHLPLSRALQEYAGTKNKKALIRLLSPVQLAAESSPVIRDLVDTGDIYHPLAWSPGEAYEFLRDAPQYEQCGVVVRLPDWWKKRSRPHAGVTIGERKIKNFNADSLLDFKLHIALGTEPLSKAELKKLMAAGDGLFFIKGQWVEVDQKKLSEALAHWKKVEAETANGGLTFAEGMRLLAGAPIDLVLTTYGTLMRQEWLQQQAWRRLMLDEAQAIKNPAARQSKAVKRLNAESRIALTGTPVENRLSDLWSLFDFLNPGLLGSATRFKGFVKSLSKREHDQYTPLRNLVNPYILRRLKTDRSIISDLPEKIEVPAYCGLSKVQAVQYQQAVEQMAKAIEDLDGIKRRGLVLSYLLRFKQICNHPSQLLGDDEYAPKKSGKFLRLAELCEEIVSRQEKLLVFTQFREMTAPLEKFLSVQFGRRGLVLHGGTAVKHRQKLVEQFQDDEGPPFFILSLKAGGTGLNLTQASHVIHFDRWWNPAVENQATDRAFRIGQKKNVLVHKFVCQGTIEEKIDALINEKMALANDLLAGGADTLLTEMDNEALLNLVSLDIDKAQV